MNIDKHILVVDDSSENLRVVGNLLKEKGYKIALAEDGESALKILDQQRIDLILLDIMMPTMDGFEVCSRIKANQNLSDIPVIFLTASRETQDLVTAFKAGGVDYLQKPFIREELLARIDNHIELAAARNRILDLVSTRDKLYSIIAHDIRSPFSNLILTLTALKDGTISTQSELFVKTIDLLLKSSEYTLSLINNLMEWSKLQNGTLKIDPQPNNIFYLLTDCNLFFKPSADNKQISIELDLPTDTVGFFDATTIQTVFRNLLSNAIKFTLPGGTIRLSSQQVPGYIKISIADNGIGMSQDMLKMIFEEKQHFTSRGTQNELGSGLGLTIVTDFVKLNNGTIEVSSKPDIGTTFTLTLPVKPI